MQHEVITFLFMYAKEIAVAVVMCVSAIFLVVGIRILSRSRSQIVRDRLQRSIETDETEANFQEDDTPEVSLRERFISFVTRIARPTSDKEMGHLRQKLAQAGFRKNSHALWYLGMKMLLAVMLVGMVVWVNSMRTEGINHLPFVLVLCMICGFYAPGLWLHSRVATNKRILNRALPDALDLLVTCVESGLGLDAAMKKVADETAFSEPLLANELRQASLEIQAGATRGEAFRRMSWRTGVEEIQNLSAIIVQTERFGTSVAKALRVMADGMRIRRMQMAEERAATVSVKMTIPLVFCIFPSLLLIILGPAIIKIYHYLMSQAGG